MKFAATVLLLGCAALACKSALQSMSFHSDTSVRPDLSNIGRAVHRLWQPFSPLIFEVEKAGRDAAGLLPKSIPALPRAEMLRLIRVSAARHNVPSAFVRSIVAAESNFDSGAISSKGAIGLMQLMPATAQEYGADPTVPEQNIDAGTRYLRMLMNRYGKYGSSLKRVIAAYNAGPGMVDRYRGVPPFGETRRYVARVLDLLRQFEIAERRGGESS